MADPAVVVRSILDELIPLADALGVHQEVATHDEVVLGMRSSRLASNHVGTIYAGASYTLAELTAGAVAAIAGAAELIPVVVASEMQYSAPATSGIRCTARRGAELQDLVPRWRQDRRLTSTVAAECRCGNVVVARGTFTYRWLGPR